LQTELLAISVSKLLIGDLKLAAACIHSLHRWPNQSGDWGLVLTNWSHTLTGPRAHVTGVCCALKSLRVCGGLHFDRKKLP